MEHSLHGSPFLSGTHSRSGLLEDGHVFFPFWLPGESVQACHGWAPVKVDGRFDDHEQTGAENVNFHLKDTNFMDSCKDFGPNFCLAVSFPIFSY